MLKHCQHCGEPFIPKYPNAKLCFHCWLAREQAFERLDALEDEISDLRAALAAAPATIPADIRRLLVLLCHPDKHNNSDASNKATRWLLALPKG